jgi:hypothetical protein
MRKPTPAENSDLQLLATQAARALVSALADSGLSASAIEGALREASSAAACPRNRRREPSQPDSAQLGTALALWHRDRRFTDTENGLPLPLQTTGRGKSLVALVRAAGIRSSPKKWATFLANCGVLRRTRDGRYLPRGRSARMPALNELHIDHVALGVYHLLRTATKNFTRKGLERPMLQSAAVVRNFPSDQQEKFRQFVNSQGDAFLANVDDYLELRSRRSASPTRRAPRRARAGVYAFAFTE